MNLGIFVKCPHPEIIEALAIAGIGFAVVDMEHTPLGPRDLYPLVLAAENRAFKLVIRIPEAEECYIKWCLDLGVRHIQVPNIIDGFTAKEVSNAVKFHPLGRRGLCRFVRAADFSGKPGKSYIQEQNEEVRVTLQIEGREAIFDNLTGIINEAIRSSSSVFVGPYDLSQSLGIPGQIDDPMVVNTIQSVIRTIRNAGVQVGTFADTPERLRFWSDKADFIEYASDLHLLMGAVRLVRTLLCEEG